MILIPIVPRTFAKKSFIYRTFKTFKSLEGYKLMSGTEGSLLPAEPKQSAEIKTLATDITLKVIGSGARGAPASVCLFTNESRYIFNCGESTQRINNEHRSKLCKLTKIGNVFITTPSWKNLGGLPGFLLCLQSYGVSNVNIHGPIGTIDIVDATRRFVYLKRLTVVEANINKPFVDNVLTVNYVLLEPKKVECDTENVKTDDVKIEDNIDYYAHEVNKSIVRKLNMYGDNVKKAKRHSNSVTGQVRSSMCYIGKIHPRIGRLNLLKCVEKGIKPGPLLGSLKNGKDVVLEDGTVVKSSDVVNPDQPGPVFIVVDCQNEELLEILIKNPVFKKHQSGTAESKEMIACCVVHFTPESILKDERYQKWMENFGWSTQHMIINESNTCLGTEAIHKVQHQMHLLHDKIFPFWNEANIPCEIKATSQNKGIGIGDIISEESSQSSIVTTDESALVCRAKSLQYFSLYPKRGLNKLMELKLHPQEYLNEVFQMNGYLDALAEVQTDVSLMEKKLGEIPEYPKLVVLGTSSTANNKMRNTSGMLFRINEDTSIVLDCGEGSIHQLFRIYGDETDNILSTIKAIYISHLHADHQLGLIGILQERLRSNKEPVYLLAPERILSWLYFFDLRYENISQSYTLISLSKLLTNEQTISLEIKEKMYETLNVKDIRTVYVDHCAFSYGVAFTLANNQKIVYSGDTMPCERLVKLGENCDLLIHEATFGGENIQHAKEKLHSTVCQAIEIGEKMNSKFTLLTHFSQRFSKTFYMPEIGERSDYSKIGMAFDNMHVRLGELPILPLFYPCLKIMCYEETQIKEVNGKKVLGARKSRLGKKISQLEAMKSVIL